MRGVHSVTSIQNATAQRLLEICRQPAWPLAKYYWHVKLVCPTASVTPCRRFSCRELPSRLELKERLVQGHQSKGCPPLMPTGLNWEHPKVPLCRDLGTCHDTAMREATAALRANCRQLENTAGSLRGDAVSLRIAA